MTSGAEDIPFAADLTTAGPAFRTPASALTCYVELNSEQPLDNAMF
jgi:hypothetical protein